MKEQEKYRQMMNEIHVSETTLRKVMEMDMSKKMFNKKNMMKKLGTIAAALTVCIAASNGICYAATGHSWMTKAIIYINGEPSEVEFEEQEDGSLIGEIAGEIADPEDEKITAEITDSDGNEYHFDITDKK